MLLTFYKEQDGKWYIFLPEWEGDKEELEMVERADVFLSIITKGGSRVVLDVSEEYDEKYRNSLVKDTTQELPSGAIYSITTYYDEPIEMDMWLCDVTKTLFNDKFPNIIYFNMLMYI